MSKRHPYMGPSEANSAALYQREHTYTEASRASFAFAYDWHKRQPRDLREAVRLVRRAYADEVPGKLHEGYDSIGEGGTPKMTARAEGYLFGSPGASDAKPDPVTGEWPIMSYYVTPFRALLAQWDRGHDSEARTPGGARVVPCGSIRHRRAAIVRHVAIARAGPREAARVEGVPWWAARLVAEDALLAFLREMSDIRVDAKVSEDVA